MDTLRIFRKEYPVRVLGPGSRAVIWVQGCHFACEECLVPESWASSGGLKYTSDELADWILSLPGIDGITFSGGEPMNQAQALCSVLDKCASIRSDMGVMCYTGYSLEYLRTRGSKHQTELLERIDLLVDGRYIPSLHADLLWRGSSNQRLIPLTHLYKDSIEALLPYDDRSAGLEFVVDHDGSFAFTGVPNKPGFRRDFERSLGQRGILLSLHESAEAK